MPIHIAMLRGINVGGHNRIKMDKLRESLTAVGLKQVATYIQSGNIVFESGRLKPSNLADAIEKKVLKDFSIAALVVVRSAKEMGAVVASNPFGTDKHLDPSRLHVIFLAEPPTAAAALELKSLTSKPDLSQLAGREIYLYLPSGMSQSSLWNNPMERRLLKRATTRTWKTVVTLHNMAQALV
jgi:uncharacterized protein (DUF1697 family)